MTSSGCVRPILWRIAGHNPLVTNGTPWKLVTDWEAVLQSEEDAPVKKF
jgi:hypothetical protein